MVHGLISSIFMFYIENPPEPGVGWNGTSWLLTGILDAGIVQIIGTLLWGLTVFLFVIAGIAVFMMRAQWRLIDIIASLVSLLAYILFWNGLEPVPEYWILGPAIAFVTLIALVVVRWPPDEWIFE
ncbi:MAG: hypothetical protein ThorAB25_19650 [Candidatus Thorarchaeota archaeon AB_25]|nr:MAG: hypothetical protein ThorAB25_19650 [Candidatus Thorarchaeota archaeon AB_25]